jgi:hypothetical protein
VEVLLRGRFFGVSCNVSFSVFVFFFFLTFFSFLELSHSASNEVAVRKFTNDLGHFKNLDEGFRQRDLLRVFDARGTQGMPFIPTPSPGNNQTAAPTPTPLEYFTPMIVVAGIGVGIAVIVLLFACFIWWCRCCCKRCCMGDTDPERKYLALRLIVLALGVVVMAAAFIALYGGKSVSTSLRSSIDAFILSLTNFGYALRVVKEQAANFGFNIGDLSSIEALIYQFAQYVQLAQKYFTPVDAARLGIL